MSTTIGTIHSPVGHATDAHMREWPKFFGPDSIPMRQCPHGIMHPDPDHLRLTEQQRGQKEAWDESIHLLCDGCCRWFLRKLPNPFDVIKPDAGRGTLTEPEGATMDATVESAAPAEKVWEVKRTPVNGKGWLSEEEATLQQALLDRMLNHYKWSQGRISLAVGNKSSLSLSPVVHGKSNLSKPRLARLKALVARLDEKGVGPARGPRKTRKAAKKKNPAARGPYKPRAVVSTAATNGLTPDLNSDTLSHIENAIAGFRKDIELRQQALSTLEELKRSLSLN